MISPTQSRPDYDNTHLSDCDQWIMDNITPLFHWYHAEPEPGTNWKGEAIHFMRSQYQLAVREKYNERYQ